MKSEILIEKHFMIAESKNKVQFLGKTGFIL